MLMPKTESYIITKTELKKDNMCVTITNLHPRPETQPEELAKNEFATRLYHIFKKYV